MEKTIERIKIALFLLFTAAQAMAVLPPYYKNEQFTTGADTKTYTNPAPNDSYYRGNYHFVASSWIAKSTACPEGVVVRATGTVEAKDIRADRIWGDGSNITGISGGSGKAVIWLTPGTVILPNTNFCRLEKVTGTNGVYYAAKFISSATAPNDETGYWQMAMPSFYAGGALTITIYSQVRTAETAEKKANFNFNSISIAHDSAWDSAITLIGNVDINPTGTSGDLLIDTITWSSNLPTAGKMLKMKAWVDASASDFVVGANSIEIIAIKIEEN